MKEPKWLKTLDKNRVAKPIGEYSSAIDEYKDGKLCVMINETRTYYDLESMLKKEYLITDEKAIQALKIYYTTKNDKKKYQSLLTIVQDSQDLAALWIAARHLGNIAFEEKDYKTALMCYLKYWQSAGFETPKDLDTDSRFIGSQGWLDSTLYFAWDCVVKTYLELGKSEIRKGNLDEARKLLKECLKDFYYENSMGGDKRKIEKIKVMLNKLEVPNHE